MAFESVRSYLQLASGLGEMTKARAMDAAQGLLALPGADEVTRRAVQATALADQILEAAKANRANLLALVQAEVEAAVRRADATRIADVDAARAALAAVTKELSDLREMLLATGTSAVVGASRAPGVGVRAGSAAVTTAVREADLSGSAGLTPATRAATKTASAPDHGTADETQGAPATRKRASRKSAATTRKTTPRKSATTSGAASESTARKSAAAKTTATKSTAKKSTAKKSTAAQGATARKSTAARTTAKKGAAGNTTAKKSTAAQGATTKRATTKRAATKRADTANG